MAGLVQFLSGDTLGNVTGVSQAAPLPVSQGVGGTAISTANPEPSANTPSSAAGFAIVPSVGQNVSALSVKTSAGNFYGATMTAGAVAGFLIAYNAAATPGSGAALTAALVLHCVPVAANGVASVGGTPIPDRCTAGIQVLFSTAATTYTIPGTLATHMRAQGV